MAFKSKVYEVLVVSSYPPSRSGGLVQDNMDALTAIGHNVDFFTLYSFPGQKENQYNIFPAPLTDKLIRLRGQFPFLKAFEAFAKKLFKTPEEKMLSIENKGYRIPHLDEATPPIDNTILSNHLPDKRYDFIQVFATERMLTTKSFVSIFEKYRVPLLITCMDMAHFTGGCYFFGDCERFSVGCGKCLVLDSKDEYDQTRLNYLVKKEVYRTIQYGILCNLHQKEYAIKSRLFNEQNIFTQSIIIDEEKFVPQAINLCREHFNIPSEKRFVILSRYEDGLARSKGYEELVKIINTFCNEAEPKLLESSVLLLVGSNNKDFADLFDMDTICLGRLSLPDLVKCYSAASVFISTSIDDAGPSMVNQSLMCGTPVGTFSIGTALEVTEPGVNGFMARNFDTDDFASKLLELCRLKPEEYNEMRRNSRRLALGINSKSSNAERIIQIYEKTNRLYQSGRL